MNIDYSVLKKKKKEIVEVKLFLDLILISLMFGAAINRGDSNISTEQEAKKTLNGTEIPK